MNRVWNRRTLFVGLTTILAGTAATLPLSAQSQGEGGASMSESGAQHAEIGTLEAVGYHNDRVVIEYPHEAQYPGTRVPSYRSFATRPSTLVEGLGSISDVEDIPATATGQIVVVTFTPGNERPMADRITFPAATRIRATHGTVESVDPASHEMTIEDTNGKEQRFALDQGFGVQIDSNDGLLDVSDLQKGQDVTVYYARPESVVTRGLAAAPRT